jgi:hypothetical protein
MRTHHKRLVWLRGAVTAPPLSERRRQALGGLLRQLQRGERLSPAFVRDAPEVGERCHELRVAGGGTDWRIICRIDPDVVVLLDAFCGAEDGARRERAGTCQWRIRRFGQQRRRKER